MKTIIFKCNIWYGTDKRFDSYAFVKFEGLCNHLSLNYKATTNTFIDTYFCYESPSNGLHILRCWDQKTIFIFIYCIRNSLLINIFQSNRTNNYNKKGGTWFCKRTNLNCSFILITSFHSTVSKMTIEQICTCAFI